MSFRENDWTVVHVGIACGAWIDKGKCWTVTVLTDSQPTSWYVSLLHWCIYTSAEASQLPQLSHMQPQPLLYISICDMCTCTPDSVALMWPHALIQCRRGH